MPRPAEVHSEPITVELWKDYDADARVLRGMAMGTHRLDGPWVTQVADLYAAGARYARLAEPVQLCAGGPWQSANALMFIRELTARGFAVNWIAHCRDGCDDDQLFSHLYPPMRVLPNATRTWRERFFPGKCAYRYGPGFVEVRDRRSGVLELVTISEKSHMDAIAALIEGVPVADIPVEVRDDFAAARLTAERAGRLWWLPNRMYRWPYPALLV